MFYKNKTYDPIPLEVKAKQYFGIDLPSFLPRPLTKVISEIQFVYQKTFSRRLMTIDRYKAEGGVLRRTQIMKMQIFGIITLHEFLTRLGFIFPPIDDGVLTNYTKAFNYTGYETTLDVHRGLGMIVGASLSFQMNFIHPLLLAKITIERFPSYWWKAFVN